MSTKLSSFVNVIIRPFLIRPMWTEPKSLAHEGTISDSACYCQETKHLRTETPLSVSATQMLSDLPFRCLSCQRRELALWATIQH